MDNWWTALGLGALAAAWTANLAVGSTRRQRLLLYPRILYSVGRELRHGHLNLCAASLVYTTLLSLVPLLAVSFSLLKGLGADQEVERVLFEFLAPLGSNGIEIGERVMGFVDNVKAGVLGSVGLLVLIYTVVSLLQKIEAAFNYAWRIEHARPLRERVSHYLSAVVVGPLLVFTSIGITATFLGSAALRDIEAYDPFGIVRSVATKSVSYLLVIAAFTFLYVYIPNARVRLRSALVGAVVAGLMWDSAGWAFGAFVVGSTRYTAIYSGFAVLIVFMLWLYVGWLVLLIGASVAFYHQHRECLGLLPHEVRLSNRLRERVALASALLVAQSHLRGTPPWNLESLSRRLGVPSAALLPLLRAMAARGILLAPTEEDDGPWPPARDLAELRVIDVLGAVREAFEGAHLGSRRLTFAEPVETLAARLEAAATELVRDLSLREWALLSSVAETGRGDETPAAEAPGTTADDDASTAPRSSAGAAPTGEREPGT